MKITLAYSPCPNDTFMFHGIASGKLVPAGWEIETHLHDIETLNQLALEETYDITKVSFHAYLLTSPRYRLLRCGAALGFGCGPLLVSKRPMEPHEVADSRIAIPGELTTAHLLLRLWAPDARDKVFTTYDRIMGLVADGGADCGVIIHEGRFVFREAGLRQIVDLGQWWEDTTDLALPLAGIVARAELAEELTTTFDGLLRESILAARANPAQALPYIRQHAQEMDETVLAKHIETFVNDHSLGLGPADDAAVARLAEMARSGGVVS